MMVRLSPAPWLTSDHCDGQRFFNPALADVASATHGLSDLLRWRAERQRKAWPRLTQNPVLPPPPSNAEAGTAAISFINHSSFLIRFANAVVLTDPIFSQRCSPLPGVGPRRVRPPGLALTDLPRLDLVLLSHNHYDHMDLPSLREIQRRHDPHIVTLLGNAAILARHGLRAVELDWWQETVVGGLSIVATPARHFAARTPFDRNRALWGGFMLRSAVDEGRVLFAGDSGAGPHWAAIQTRLGAPNVALLPIGAYEPRWFMAPVHMNPAEAVDAHLALGARRSIGMHFGTFQLTDEAIDAPLVGLEAARQAAGLADGVFSTQEFGETRVYDLANT